MRLLGTIDNQHQALVFSHFLQKKNLPHQMDAQKNTDWGSSSYGSYRCYIWVQEEEDVEQATIWLNQFTENPEDPIFQVTPSLAKEGLESPSFPKPQESPSPLSSNQNAWDKQPMRGFTRFIIIICTGLFSLAN